MLKVESAEPVTRANKGSVLVVEDDPGVALLERRRLERAGYCVVDAASIEEALKVLEQGDVELIVLDQSLPDGTGLELYAQLKADGHDLPVIIVTGQSEETTVIKALRAGVRDYVAKSPEYLDYLPEAVERVLAQVRLEQRLEKSEERFRSLIQNASDVITLLDAQGTIRYDSPTIERVLGYNPDERVGTSAFEYMHPEDTERVKRSFVEALDEPSVVQPPTEFRLRHKDGTWRHVEVTRSNLLDDPAVRSVVVNSRDVTERVRAEEVRSRLAAIVESSDDAIIRKTLDGTITSWNRAAERLYGYTKEEILGKSISVLVPPDRSDEVARMLRTIRGGQAVNNYETVQLRKDGRQVDVSLTMSPIMSSAGNVVGGSTIARDITGKKQAEERIRFQAHLLAAVGQSVIATDLEGKVVYWNRAAEKMYGWTAEETIGRSILEVTPSQDMVERANEIMSEMSQGKSWSGEFTVQRKGGTRFPALITDTPVHDEQGNLKGIIGVSVDITERKRAEEALRESEARYRALVEHAPAVIYTEVVNEVGTVAYMSPQIEDLLGYSLDELEEMDQPIWDCLHPDDRDQVLIEDERANRTGERFRTEYRLIAKDGSVVWVLDEAVLVSREEDGTLHWQGVLHNVTRRKWAEERLRQSEARHLAVLDTAFDAIVTMTPDGLVESFNKEAESIFGYAASEIVGAPVTRLMPEKFKEAHRAGLRRYLQTATSQVMGRRRVELAGRRKNGEEFPLELSLAEVRDEENILFTSIIRDITERKEAEERLRYQAFHDSLTDLPNRNLFLDRLRQGLLRTERGERIVAVLFMDLDNFKVVNDSLGHEVGDRLLVAVSERLRRNCLRQEDTLSRFGGDEFTILLDSTTRVSDVVRVAERIAKEFRTPFSLDGREVFVSVSIGIAVGFSSRNSPQELLRNADVAMYRAKQEGKGNYQVFDPSMHNAALKRLHLENDLRRAMERKELRVHYQPKVMLESEEIVGVEALVRWEHPQHGLVFPEEFIPLAEETGLIVPLGEWVLQEACRQTKEWQDRYLSYATLEVSVNLSPRQFHQPDLVGNVARILKETELASHTLGLEVTETAVAHDPDSARDTLHKLKDLGIQIEVDDFGTGYSSLSRLRHLPIDVLKIDRSFVSSLETDAEVEPVISAITNLSAGLGLRAVAEGVETPEQARHLEALGCKVAQGYFFSKPLPGEALDALLAATTRGRSTAEQRAH